MTALEQHPMPRQQPEGANCGDLPAFVVDKYFGANANTERQRAKVALAICSRCAVITECRTQALAAANLQTGIIGGVTVSEIRKARRWRLYEQGLRDTVPDCARPEWLEMTDATHMVEQERTELENEL